MAAPEMNILSARCLGPYKLGTHSMSCGAGSKLDSLSLIALCLNNASICVLKCLIRPAHNIFIHATNTKVSHDDFSWHFRFLLERGDYEKRFQCNARNKNAAKTRRQL